MKESMYSLLDITMYAISHLVIFFPMVNLRVSKFFVMSDLTKKHDSYED